jgi:benzoyl-CoA reductase subunit C
MSSPRAAVVDWATAIADDLDFTSVAAWLDERPGRKACGFLPVYVPKELIHATGMLPVGVHGGGDRLEIIKGDAFYQSYICHLPRSIVELAQSARLSRLSAMLFPSTCDVIRNLSGIWQLTYPDIYVKYVDLPQVAGPGGRFWEGELKSLLRDLGEVSGTPATDTTLRESVALYNEVRRTVRALYAARSEAPWKIPTEELYQILRAGEVVPPEVFLEKARAYLAAVEVEPVRMRDQVRVIVVGAFCEQPPIGLIKTIERSGCAIVDDDLILGNRLIGRDVPLDGDPIASLVETFLSSAMATSILFERDPSAKRRLMKERATAARADGILFAAASFCDPALLDRPMLRAGAEEAGIPSLAFQFSENTAQLQQFREQAGTFADSIKLWGAA